MLNGNFIESHEYYISILKIRLGEDIYDSVYKKVYTSEYYSQVVIKFRKISKFPDYLQIMLISNANLNQKNKLHINLDLLEAIILLKFLNEKINIEYSIESEESIIALQKDIFNGFENCIYYTY